MNKYTIEYLLFLLLAIMFTMFWGKAMTLYKNSKLINSFVRFLMRYLRSQFNPIKFYTLAILYGMVGLLGTITLSVLFDFNIFGYFWLQPRYIVYILIGFVGQVSMSSMILLIIGSIRPTINWFNVMQSITWVNLMYNMPKMLLPLYPILGAFFEELFYRGTVYMIHRTYFPEMGLIWPIVLTTALFTFQQILNTNTVLQGIVISSGAVVISVIGSLLIEYTGSFLPALMSHLLFVIFYLGGSETNKATYST